MLRAFNNRRRWIKETSSRACSGTLGCMDTSFPRHPGLVPGPKRKGRVLKTTTFSTSISKIPDIAGAIPGRRMGIFASRFRDDGCVDTSFHRHPGRVPGPWLAPGPFQRQ